MMVFYLSRDRVSYFQSYKQYFVAIYIAFLGFPSGDLLLMLSFPYWFMQLAVRIFVTSGGIIAAIWGYVATKLYVYPQPLSAKRILSRPFQSIFLVFLGYLAPMSLAVALAWLDPSSVPINTSFQLNYILEGVSLPAVRVGPVLLATGGAIVAVFTIYPLAILSRRSALVTDREVRTALRIIAVVFGMISATLILGIGISSFGISITGFTNLVSVALIIIAVRAFRKPTFLKAFLGVVPSLQSSPTATRYDQMVLIHSLTDDKFGPISKYLVDGVNQRERIIYFYNGDVVPVDEGLSRHGIDVTKLMLKGSLRVLPLSSAYPSKTRLDGTPLAVVRELASEAKRLGNEGLRVILDYDDFVIRPIQKFVEHLSDPGWTSPDHRLHVLMAFDSSTFKGEEASLAQLEKNIRTLDLSEAKDIFAATVGLPHDEIAGRKLLFEFDPQWDYEKVFKSVLAETASDFERTVVFTRRDSPIYSMVQKQPAAKIFVLTSRVSYPKVEGENLFLLPTYDTSLFLDALNKTLEAYSGSSFTIIFDNLSHFIFTLGPERTYSLVRQALELMVSDKITAIFAMNSKAHDQKVLSTFENMFDIEIVGEMGKTMPEIKKKLSFSTDYERDKTGLLT